MRWLGVIVAGGWLALVALAWRLADSRAHLCWQGYYWDTACLMRAYAIRDHTLLVGLSLPVAIGAVIVMRNWRGQWPINARRGASANRAPFQATRERRLP